MTTSLKKLFTLPEYHRLGELGFFTEDERIELINGEIIQMSAKGTRHTVCCTRLLRELSQLLGNQATLKCQDPITLSGNSEPEPDFVIVRNKDDDYLVNHPYPSDIILVLEIAESSLVYDREVKLQLYAQAGIKDYWLFNLVHQQLETYSNPYQAYRQQIIYLPEQKISLPEFPDLCLDLSRVFPNI